MLRPSGFPFYNSVELIYFAVSPCIRVHARKAEGNTSVLSSKIEGKRVWKVRKWMKKENGPLKSKVREMKQGWNQKKKELSIIWSLKILKIERLVMCTERCL